MEVEKSWKEEKEVEKSRKEGQEEVYGILEATFPGKIGGMIERAKMGVRIVVIRLVLDELIVAWAGGVVERID